MKQLEDQLAELRNKLSHLESAEKALAESGSELLKAQEIAHMGSWALDLKTGGVTWTPELHRIYGLSPDQEVPDFDEQQRYLSPDSWQRLNQKINEAIRTGEPYQVELEINRQSGETVWIRARGDIQKDASGTPVTLRGVAQDITEAILLRNALHAEYRFAERISAMSPAGISVVDAADSKYLYVNKQHRVIFGTKERDREKMSALDFRSKIHADDRAAYQQHLKRLAEDCGKSKVEFRFMRDDGQLIWCHTAATAFEKNEKGEVLSFISCHIDITRQKEIEAELTNALERAESASRYKDQFLANMSHEIRTPLNGILGFAQLLRDDSLPRDDKSRYLDIINDCSQRLLGLINDIMDLSKIEVGEMSLHEMECKPYEILKGCQETFSVMAGYRDGSDAKFIIRVKDDEKNLVITTDPNRLQQVLTNLLDNALKYGKGNDIVYGYRSRDSDIEFFVRDKGLGISKDDLKRIFSRFTRLKDVNNEYEGSGLGLSLCKAIVELMGGRISVSSTPGLGSEFKFSLPRSPAESRISC